MVRSMARIYLKSSSNMKTEGKPEEKTESNNLSPILNKRTLRGYQLHDSIILTNYENITHLEVCDNNIEYLDLRTLKKLEVLHCRKNTLSELTLNGESLLSLTATHNDLTKITVLPAPSKLTTLDIRCNRLSKLPHWLDKCHNLEALYASNNKLEEVPNHLISSERTTLHTLHLANNKLKALPNTSKKKIHLRDFSVQCNDLHSLPENLLYACNELVTLNISYNSLEALPILEEGYSPLERLYATKNDLNDTIFQSLVHLKKLKIVHLAYNRFASLPSKCISNWPELEELILSGNKLEILPESISSLKRLKVLRLHSNRLQSIPDLSRINTLRVIDLAHNQLGKINLQTLLPKNVQFLDLSCNQQLRVDSGQLKSFQTQRRVSFVDVSGKNRFCLPTTPAFENGSNSYTPWKVGFSETPGKRQRLYISQLRLPNFCNTDGLFGMFDGELKTTSMTLLPKIIPTILLQQQGPHQLSADYMKYTLIAAYKQLRENDEKYGECAILCHIARENQFHESSVKPLRSRKYNLRAAIVGGSTAYLIRKQGPVLLPPTPAKAKLENGLISSTPLGEAKVFDVSLSNDDEYLVIGSKRIWETMQIETVMQEIRSEDNVILAAKRIQDVAQSFGADENLSVIILKFQHVETYVDLLINELRQNVRRKNSSYNCTGCCNSSDGSPALVKQLYANSDRSSPIGQTDQEISELSVCLKRVKPDAYCFAESGISSAPSFPAVVEEESDQNINETDSVLSEEQFKCWEYMLEQNTQLLFDKELNKISNSFTKYKNSASNLNLSEHNTPTAFNLLTSASKKKISASYPSYGRDSIASKHFGTARSFQHIATVKTRNVSSTENLRRTLGSGANVGYFGSLQHLMPYNFEDDFAVTHERQFGDESMEYASRMSQYWGVATTEL